MNPLFAMIPLVEGEAESQRGSRLFCPEVPFEDVSPNDVLEPSLTHGWREFGGDVINHIQFLSSYNEGWLLQMESKRSDLSETPEAARRALTDLEQLFPERAFALLAMLQVRNRGEKKFPDWREQQIRNLGLSLIVSAGDLARAYGEERITAVAWSTRNLLELSIWIEYCNLSDTHAKTFHEDAMRDLFGLSNAVKKSAEVDTGQPSTALDESLAKFVRFAESKGIKELKDDFKSVSSAAKELGREDEFKAMNKLLSKFAHPTAWAVHVVDLVHLERGYLTMILQDGVSLAMNGIITLRKSIRDKYPEIAKSKAE